MSDFAVAAREEVLRSHVFTVEHRTVAGAGTTFERDVVVHPGAVAIAARREDGALALLRQYRATFDNVAWELPAGTRDVVGEPPEETARRELREELGCEATTMRELFHYMNSRGWTTQTTIVFEATGLTMVEREPHGPEEEGATIHWLSPAEQRALLTSGELLESSTVLVLTHLVGGDV